MNNNFWNLGNSETSFLPEGEAAQVVDVEADIKTERELPCKHDILNATNTSINTNRADVYNTGEVATRGQGQEKESQVSISASGFKDLNMVLADLPQDVVENMPTIQSRINAYLTYFSAMNLARLPRLMQFIQSAEDLMFNPKDLAHLDFEQITEIYKCAKFSSNEILESARKVSQTVQQEKDRKVDALYSSLTSLSPATVEKLLSMIEEERSG